MTWTHLLVLKLLGLGREQSGGFKEYILDPDHVIVRDLFVTVKDASNDFYNYMVVVEEYSITDDEAIINIIKEGSQSL